MWPLKTKRLFPCSLAGGSIIKPIQKACEWVKTTAVCIADPGLGMKTCVSLSPHVDIDWSSKGTWRGACKACNVTLIVNLGDDSFCLDGKVERLSRWSVFKQISCRGCRELYQNSAGEGSEFLNMSTWVSTNIFDVFIEHKFFPHLVAFKLQRLQEDFNGSWIFFSQSLFTC